MRGSTAGLADTLASGSRAHAALLELADTLFASIVVAPAVVAYWKSTWSLMDLYVLPENQVGSAAVCAAFGLCCDFLLCLRQTQLSRYLCPDRGRITYYVLSRLYTCVAGVACVGAWRGVWNLLNECTGDSAKTLLSTTGAATGSLMMLRSLRNICAAPFAVAVDSPQDYFEVPTMFRTSTRETALYVLDCVFSVAVVGSLVVFVWRGSWALLDIFLFPDDAVRSCWTSVVKKTILSAYGSGAAIRAIESVTTYAPQLVLPFARLAPPSAD
ncbi:hypothetical protein MSG28_006519 [Choristoneura fumiferana]|uniref:Uncharacterized protein n=1 Tax=Choristoneura fumiferana TaxID=7141 RepID=A0ACC0JFE5_CHOFU|nr:hypothetical protein MSG28_006519 [Choristoneura fumiferana]